MDDITVIRLKDYPDKITDLDAIYYKHKNGNIIKFNREDIYVMWQDKFLGFIVFETCPFTKMWLEDYNKTWYLKTKE